MGQNAFRSVPYEGAEPHGVILATIEGTIQVDGRTGTVIVKNNLADKGSQRRTWPTILTNGSAR